MEKSVEIKTKDGHIIYGALNLPKKKTDTLIIFVHGLGGYRSGHMFFNAVPFFNKRGLAVCRFDLYCAQKNARSLTKSSLSTHAKDIDTVFRHFAKIYKKIFLVGHSFGGLSILLSESCNDANGVILWDSSTKPEKIDTRKDFKYNKNLKAFIVSFGVDVLLSKKMIEEWKATPYPAELMKNIKVPIKVIVAGKGGLMKAGREYFKSASEPKDFAIIKNATHNFEEEGVDVRLYNETYSWIKKFK